jgi:hypothetical protein
MDRKARILAMLLEERSMEEANRRNDDNQVRSTVSAYETELRKTKLTIFTPLSDHGYFGWKPDANMSQRLSAVRSSKEIVDHIDLNETPPTVVPISHFRLPMRFHTDLPPTTYASHYPYGNYYIASLYAATQLRDVSLKEIDFVFGSSTLEMLAQQILPSPFLVTLVPSTERTIIVANCKDYILDLSEAGYQFKRLVTGLPMDQTPSRFECVEHSTRCKSVVPTKFCFVPMLKE